MMQVCKQNATDGTAWPGGHDHGELGLNGEGLIIMFFFPSME